MGICTKNNLALIFAQFNAASIIAGYLTILPMALNKTMNGDYTPSAESSALFTTLYLCSKLSNLVFGPGIGANCQRFGIKKLVVICLVGADIAVLLSALASFVSPLLHFLGVIVYGATLPIMPMLWAYVTDTLEGNDHRHFIGLLYALVIFGYMFGGGHAMLLFLFVPGFVFLIMFCSMIVFSIVVGFLMEDLSPPKFSRRDVLLKDCLPTSGVYSLSKQSPACLLIYMQIFLYVFAMWYTAAIVPNYLIYRYGWSLGDYMLWGQVTGVVICVSCISVTRVLPLSSIYNKVLYPAVSILVCMLVASPDVGWWYWLVMGPWCVLYVAQPALTALYFKEGRAGDRGDMASAAKFGEGLASLGGILSGGTAFGVFLLSPTLKTTFPGFPWVFLVPILIIGMCMFVYQKVYYPLRTQADVKADMSGVE